MPSVSHESLVTLFRDCPTLAPELLRRVADAGFPAGVTARVTSAEFTDLDAAEYRADVVVRLDMADNKAAEAIIVEVQLGRDGQKRKRWPHYMTGVYTRLGCLTTLLVVAINDSVAAWCAKPIALDRNGSVICPVVIGPRQMPRITDFAQAREFPELAVLSAAAHGKEKDAAEIALVALSACHGLDMPRSTRYHDFVMASLGKAARRVLENLMSQHKYEYQSDFAKKYVAEGERAGREAGERAGREAGERAGREAGERAVVLRLLAKRFGPLSAAELERIEQADISTLDRWAECLLTAQTLDEVLSS